MGDVTISVNERRAAMRRLSTEDPMLREKPEITQENGMTVIQVGDENEPQNSNLTYTEDKYANPMKTAIDIESKEQLCPALKVSGDLLSAHREFLRNLCQPTSSKNNSGTGMKD